MHVNAALANELRAWDSGKPHDSSMIEQAQTRGLIAPDPKTRTGKSLTRKGQDFIAKWR